MLETVETTHQHWHDHTERKSARAAAIIVSNDTAPMHDTPSHSVTGQSREVQHLCGSDSRGCLHGFDGLNELLHVWRLVVMGPSVVGALSLQIHVENPHQTLHSTTQVVERLEKATASGARMKERTLLGIMTGASVFRSSLRLLALIKQEAW